MQATNESLHIAFVRFDVEDARLWQNLARTLISQGEDRFLGKGRKMHGPDIDI